MVLGKIVDTRRVNRPKESPNFKGPFGSKHALVEDIYTHIARVCGTEKKEVFRPTIFIFDCAELLPKKYVKLINGFDPLSVVKDKVSHPLDIKINDIAYKLYKQEKNLVYTLFVNEPEVLKNTRRILKIINKSIATETSEFFSTLNLGLSKKQKEEFIKWKIEVFSKDFINIMPNLCDPSAHLFSYVAWPINIILVSLSLNRKNQEEIIDGAGLIWSYFKAIHTLFTYPCMSQDKREVFAYPLRLAFLSTNKNMNELTQFNLSRLCNLQQIEDTKENRTLLRQQMIKLKTLVDTYTPKDWLELFCFFDLHVLAISNLSKDRNNWPLSLMLECIDNKKSFKDGMIIQDGVLDNIIAERIFENLELNLFKYLNSAITA